MQCGLSCESLKMTLSAFFCSLFLFRFGTNSPPPGVHSQAHFANSASSGNSATATPDNADFNPTAAYLWLLSQQQQQQHLPNAAAAAAALNLSREVSSRNAANNFLNGNSASSANNGSPNLSNSLSGSAHNNSKEFASDAEKASPVTVKEKSKNHPTVLADEERKPSNGVASNGTSPMISNNQFLRKQAKAVEEEDAEDSSDDDDAVSRNSSNAENPVSSSGFNGKRTSATL